TLAATDAGTLDAGTISPVSFAGVENLMGGADSDTFVITSEGKLSGILEGGQGSDTVIGADTPNTWVITGVDAGTLNGQPFAGVENLTGGGLDDTFVWVVGGTL